MLKKYLELIKLRNTEKKISRISDRLLKKQT